MDRRSVLLVESSIDERELYEWGLPPHGFDVRSMEDLGGIGEAVAQHRPDVLVLSLRLGDDRTWHLLDGLGCGEALQVPAVLLTGSIRPDGANRDRAQLSGCAAFVTKPCTPADLAAILHAVIEGARGLVITDPAAFAQRQRVHKMAADGRPGGTAADL